MREARVDHASGGVVLACCRSFISREIRGRSRHVHIYIFGLLTVGRYICRQSGTEWGHIVRRGYLVPCLCISFSRHSQRGKFSKGGSISPSSIGFSIAEAPCGVLLVSSVDRFCCCRKISSLTLFKVSDNLLWSLIGIQGLFFSSELPRSGVGESGLGNGRFSYIPESDSEGFGTN